MRSVVHYCGFFFFSGQNLLFLNLISVVPDLRGRKKFWKRERKENSFFIWLLTLAQRRVSCLVFWPYDLETRKTRNWYHQKLATEIMLLLQKRMITTASVKKNLNRETLYSFPIQIQRKYSIFNLILSLPDWLLKETIQLISKVGFSWCNTIFS